MSRRQELADVAIATLAREGMRGLTHRAVDRAAGLPEGSTSYYFRTRDALLEAVVRRLAEVTAGDLGALPTSAPGGLDGLAHAIAAVLERWVTEQADRHLARYELALEANRRPRIRDLLSDTGARLRDQVADLMAASGVPVGPERAADLVAYLDGLVFDRLAGAGTARGRADDFADRVRPLLAAMADGEPKRASTTSTGNRTPSARHGRQRREGGT